VYASSLNSMLVTDCTFSNNVGSGGVDSGAGVCVSGIANMIVSNTVFLNNRVTSAGYPDAFGGGGAYLAGATMAEFKECVFSENQNNGTDTGQGGGALCVAVDSANTVTVENCTLVKNSSVGAGGAVRLKAGNLVVRNSTIAGNSATI